MRPASARAESGLGSTPRFFYVVTVINFWRFIGVMNAAVWLGGGVFFTLVAGPAFFSADMRGLLGANNYPYYSGAIAQLVLKRYFLFHIICGGLALFHLLIQRFCLGRSNKFSLALVAGLLALTLIGGNWLEPHLSGLHATRYATQTPPAERETAAQAFRTWHAISQIVNLLILCGLATHVWQATAASDTTRFVGSVKFRD
jgi:hypothetical protein